MPDTNPFVGASFALRVGAAMVAAQYHIEVGPDVVNIIYVEGMSLDGKPNANRPNAFDATRLLLRVTPEAPLILGAWEAITHAGMWWETHRMNPAGAFHIALGQQACWRMGNYHDQEALIQAMPIRGTRDADNSFHRVGPTVTGDFGVHHHWGYDYPHDDAGKSSAGCQVGRTKSGHREFIVLLKTDRRYIADPQFLWPSTVLTAEQVPPA